MRKILLSLAAWFAERERMILIERTKQGMQRARKEGKRIGRPPKMEQVVSEVVSTLMRKGANKSTLTKISKKYNIPYHVLYYWTRKQTMHVEV